MSRVVYTDTKYLTADTQDVLRRFMAFLKIQGLNPRIEETYRSQSAEEKIYSDIIHKKRAGIPTKHSWHTVGRAVDMQISPATTENILFFLDHARDYGFVSPADPDQARAAIAQGNEAQTNRALFDWHHLSYHPGKTWAQAYTEYQTLLGSAPRASASILEVLSQFLFIGSLLGVGAHYATSD